MILYCHNCNQTHEFTPGQIERLIYTLQGQYADALCSDKIDGDPHPITTCLKDTLGDSWCSECYLEFTAGLVECRQRLGGEHRAQVREMLAVQRERGGQR